MINLVKKCVEFVMNLLYLRMHFNIYGELYFLRSKFTHSVQVVSEISNIFQQHYNRAWATFLDVPWDVQEVWFQTFSIVNFLIITYVLF
jgi:hypothetical protein